MLTIASALNAVVLGNVICGSTPALAQRESARTLAFSSEDHYSSHFRAFASAPRSHSREFTAFLAASNLQLPNASDSATQNCQLLPATQTYGVGRLAADIQPNTLAPFAASLPPFTAADADTAVDSYIKAFVTPKGDGSFIKGDQNGGDPGFWQEIEQIEGIEDANDRTHGKYNGQVSALLNGFVAAHGSDWSYNIYNDDISWATMAFTRGYLATKNKQFLTIAKSNFDTMFARAWNPANGALYWTTDKTSYNSCIECPAGVAAYMLSLALKDQRYTAKAQSLYTWEKANLVDSSTGAVWDAINVAGKIGTWSSTYNQGTFIGLADDLGHTAIAEQSADYMMHHIGSQTPNGTCLMPEYGSGGDNNAGLNSIGLRWVAKFMKVRHLQSRYLPWLQMNANTAWNIRRTSDNLSWDQWLHPTPDGVLHSWDCINSVVALQVTPPASILGK